MLQRIRDRATVSEVGQEFACRNASQHGRSPSDSGRNRRAAAKSYILKRTRL